MLIFSGTLPNGESVFEKVISAKEVMELFPMIPKMGKYVEFQRGSKYVKIDTENGGRRTGRGFAFAPVFTIPLPTGDLTVRYADNRVPVAGGEFRYTMTGEAASTGKMHDFNSEVLVFTQPNRIERYIWYFLNPANENAPFRHSRTTSYYRFVNREQEAVDRLSQENMLQAIRLEIMQMPEATLRIVASGLSYKHEGLTRTINATDTVTVDELRLSLLTLIGSDKNDFAEAWRSGNNHLSGMIQFAVDKGIIKRMNFIGGANWVWGIEGYENHAIVAIVPTEPEMATLKRAFAENYNALFPTLNAAVNEVRINDIELPEDVVLEGDENLRINKILEKGWDWVVDQAVLKNVIALDRAAKVVRYVEDGEFAGDIMQVNDAKTWIPEMKAFLDSYEGSSQRFPIAKHILAAMGSVATQSALGSLELTARVDNTKTVAKPTKKPELSFSLTDASAEVEQ